MLENFLREYNFNRVLLSHVGLWPFQNKLARNVLPIFCLLVELSYIPFEILLLYDHRDNMETFCDGCYQMILSMGFTARMLNEFWNYNKLRHLYQTVNDHWNIFSNDTEIQILKDYSFMCRKFTKVHSSLIFGMAVGFTLIPLAPIFLDIIRPLNESRPRALAIEVEFRVDKNEYFLPIFIYITVIIVVGMSIMVGVDAMHIACTAHACSLFAAISYQIENITSKVDDEICKYRYLANTDVERLREKIMYREYVICLKKHQLAIEFVDIFRSTYEKIALVLLMLSITAFSVIGMRIVYVLGQFEEMTRFIFLMIGVLTNLLIVCYSGQKLMDESQNIFDRAYAAEWYNFSPRVKSLLIIILYRSSVSCGLTAGGVVPLSITTFASVVRVGVSYFTAFLSLKE